MFFLKVSLRLLLRKIHLPLGKGGNALFKTMPKHPHKPEFAHKTAAASHRPTNDQRTLVVEDGFPVPEFVFFLRDGQPIPYLLILSRVRGGRYYLPVVFELF